METGRKRLILLGVTLMGLASRTALAPVGVLQEQIRAGTGLSHGALGMLTTIPVVMFALSSLLVSQLRMKIGLCRAMTVGLALLAAGIPIRSWCGEWGLFAGTVLLGLGMSVANVLIPTIVKESFPEHSGAVTGLYTSCMYIASAAAAFTAMPLLRRTGSWRTALGFWLVTALAAGAVWLLLCRGEPAGGEKGASMAAGLRRLMRSPMAWWVTLLMGSQSVIYYSVMAWLPAIVQSRGLSGEVAGQVTSVFQLFGMVGAVLCSLAISRLKEQRALCAGFGAAFLAAVALLAFGGSPSVFLLSAVVLGISCSGGFSAAYCVIALRSATTEESIQLSGMAQTFGYCLAAAGPALLGSLYEVFGAWPLPLAVLAAAAAAYTVAGLKAGKPGTV